MNESDIEPFIRGTIAKYSLSTKGYGNLRTLVYAIFKYAKKHKLISWSITNTIKDMDISRKAFQKIIKEDNEEVFNDEETDKITAYIMENPDIKNLGVLLMFCTGIRVGELAALKWSDFDENVIRIRRTETTYKTETGEVICEVKDYPKTPARVRTVIIPDKYQFIIKRLHILSGFSEYVFQNRKGRIKADAIRKRLYLICNKTGVRKKSPHKIRKTYASILLDNGLDRNLVESVLGHT